MGRHREWPQMAILHWESWESREEHSPCRSRVYARTLRWQRFRVARVPRVARVAYRSSQVVKKTRLVNELEVAR